MDKEISPDKRAQLVNHVRLFYRHGGPSVYLVLALVLLGSFIEIIGITMILPLIELIQGPVVSGEMSRTFMKAFGLLGLKGDLGTVLIVIVVTFVAKGLIMTWQNYMLSRTSIELARSLRSTLLNELSNVSYEHFTTLKSGTVANVIFREVELFSGAFIRFISLTATFIYVFIYFAAATTLSWEITSIVISVGCLLLFLMRFAIRLTRTYSHMITESYGDTQAFTLQAFGGYLYLKATDTFRLAQRHIDKGFSHIAYLQRAMALISAAIGNISEPFAVILLASLIYFQVTVAQQPISEVIVIALIFHRAFGRLMSIQIEWQKFNRGLGSVSVVQDYLDAFAINKDQPGTTAIKSVSADITLKNVNYAYGNKNAITDFSAKIRHKTSVGIVGESGAGKSTLFLLLTGMLRPDSGEIRIGDVAYSGLDMRSLRQKIGFVPQEPMLLDDTIANNICMFKGHPDDPKVHNQIEWAARQANCIDFIRDLEGEFSTVVGERGIALSGGQRQRIAIARELFKDPALIIFDEATSALDTQSERIVRDSIDKLGKDRTLIIIAHRLSTIRQCDEILVMSRGRLVERGQFDDLAEDNASYFRSLLEQQKL